jgi:hypothetical protein
MRVQSPVGEFPVTPVAVHLKGGAPSVELAMGAWRSRVSLTRQDGPLIAAVLAVLALVYLAGRRS